MWKCVFEKFSLLVHRNSGCNQTLKQHEKDQLQSLFFAQQDIPSSSTEIARTEVAPFDTFFARAKSVRNDPPPPLEKTQPKFLSFFWGGGHKKSSFCMRVMTFELSSQKDATIFHWSPKQEWNVTQSAQTWMEKRAQGRTVRLWGCEACSLPTLVNWTHDTKIHEQYTSTLYHSLLLDDYNVSCNNLQKLVSPTTISHPSTCRVVSSAVQREAIHKNHIVISLNIVSPRHGFCEP